MYEVARPPVKQPDESFWDMLGRAASSGAVQAIGAGVGTAVGGPVGGAIGGAAAAPVAQAVGQSLVPAPEAKQQTQGIQYQNGDRMAALKQLLAQRGINV